MQENAIFGHLVKLFSRSNSESNASLFLERLTNTSIVRSGSVYSRNKFNIVCDEYVGSAKYFRACLADQSLEH